MGSRVDWEDEEFVIDGVYADTGWTISYLDVLLVIVTLFAVLLTLNGLAQDDGEGSIARAADETVSAVPESPRELDAIGNGSAAVAESPASGIGSLALARIDLLADTALPPMRFSSGEPRSSGETRSSEETREDPAWNTMADPVDGAPSVGTDTVEPTDASVAGPVIAADASRPMDPPLPGDQPIEHAVLDNADEPAQESAALAASPAALDLASRLLAEMGERDFEIVLEEDRFRIELQDAILFGSGQAELNPGGRRVLGNLAPWLAETDRVVTVEGHTDNRPIATARFPSNWELSSLRATLVARELIALGLPAQRVRVVGYADTRPRAPNDSDDQRALNRRVTLVVETPARTSRVGVVTDGAVTEATVTESADIAVEEVEAPVPGAVDGGIRSSS